jgi:hypothetical protein
MERKSYQPFALSIGLMILASAVIALTVRPAPLGEAGVVLDEEGNPKLPDRVGIWVGEDQAISQEEINTLPEDTRFARKIYKDPYGHQLLCSVVLSGSDRGSIHRPEVCLPGQGYIIQNSELVNIPLDSEGKTTLGARRLLISKEIELESGQPFEFFRYYYYWFVGSDLTTPKHGDRIFQATFDRIAKNVSHRWAYVTVAPDLIPEGKEDEIAEVCRGFIRDIFPLFHRAEVVPR